MHIPGSETRRTFLDQKSADAVIFRLSPNDSHIGQRTVCDPHLLTVYYVAIATACGARTHSRGIRAELSFRQAETANSLAALQSRQPSVFLSWRAICVDGIHH